MYSLRDSGCVTGISARFGFEGARRFREPRWRIAPPLLLLPAPPRPCPAWTAIPTFEWSCADAATSQAVPHAAGRHKCCLVPPTSARARRRPLRVGAEGRARSHGLRSRDSHADRQARRKADFSTRSISTPPRVWPGTLSFVDSISLTAEAQAASARNSRCPALSHKSWRHPWPDNYLPRRLFT